MKLWEMACGKRQIDQFKGFVDEMKSERNVVSSSIFIGPSIKRHSYRWRTISSYMIYQKGLTIAVNCSQCSSYRCPMRQIIFSCHIVFLSIINYTTVTEEHLKKLSQNLTAKKSLNPLPSTKLNGRRSRQQSNTRSRISTNLISVFLDECTVLSVPK